MFLSAVFYSAFFFLTGCAKAPAGRALPDFSLTAVASDGTTSPLNLNALRGRVWVADFVYASCPGPCPMLSANMAGLQKRLPPAVGLLTFTVDPDHDSPRVLAAYAAKFKADPKRWLFVTGARAEMVELLQKGFLVAAVKDAGGLVAHSTKFVLLDSDARVRGYYDGDDPASLDKLAADAVR